MENIADRINHLIADLSLSKNEFAKRIGISSSLISQITTKKNNFRSDILQKITSEFPLLNSDWLLNGIGEMWSETHTQNPHLYPHLSTDIEVKQGGVSKGGTRGGDTASPSSRTIEGNDVGVMLDAVSHAKYLESFKGDNKAEFYYSHSLSKVNLILKNAKDELKEAFEDYEKLVAVSINLGCPEWMIEKFPPTNQSFKDLLKEVNQDLKDDYDEISDRKLFQCFKITEYENNTRYYKQRLTKLINFMDMYTDRFDKNRIIGQPE